MRQTLEIIASQDTNAEAERFHFVYAISRGGISETRLSSLKRLLVGEGEVNVKAA